MHSGNWTHKWSSKYVEIHKCKKRLLYGHPLYVHRTKIPRQCPVSDLSLSRRTSPELMIGLQPLNVDVWCMPLYPAQNRRRPTDIAPRRNGSTKIIAFSALIDGDRWKIGRESEVGVRLRVYQGLCVVYLCVVLCHTHHHLRALLLAHSDHGTTPKQGNCHTRRSPWQPCASCETNDFCQLGGRKRQERCRQRQKVVL